MRAALVCLLVAACGGGKSDREKVEKKPAPPDAPPPRCMPSCDLSTRQGLNAAYDALGIYKPTPDCIDRSLPGMVVAAHNNPDVGCMDHRVWIDCCVFDLGDTKGQLARLGWAEKTPEERARLALAYVQARPYGTMLFEKPAEWRAEQTFAPPESKPVSGGGVVITAWTTDQQISVVGLLPEMLYLNEWTFSPSGEMKHAVKTELPLREPKGPKPGPDGLTCVPGCDVTSKEGVQKAYQALGIDDPEEGFGLPERCFAPVASFPNVVRTGTKGMDGVCSFGDVLVDCCLGSVYSGEARVLKRLGWADADEDKRKQLALAYELEVVSADEVVKTAIPEIPRFTPPSVEMRGARVVVSYWERLKDTPYQDSLYQKIEVEYSWQGYASRMVVDSVKKPATP